MALIARSCLRFRKFVTLGGLHVVHMHRFLVDDRASCGPVAIDGPFVAACWYWPMMRTWLKVVTDLETQDRVIGTAKFASALDNGPQHRSNSVGEDAITLRMLLLPV